ncbi:zinc-binding dehydrogenase [Dyella acidisoli]|uniref:zinc-binding dehydrogenase n=1 Tax=Dyella acidisoli TaxID=1867834 RepID=UPI0024E0B8CE|nr:zinc-binding dehydrogenase [Dyella acidisoli]
MVTPVDGLDSFSASQLAVTMRHLVPYGGLIPGRLTAGETLVVSGATAAYGSAVVMVALAMDARQVVALGRDATKLRSLVAATNSRVTPLVVTDDVAADAAHIREMTDGGADVAFNMMGGATDPNMTLSALRSLVNGGRLVPMESMAAPLPLPYLDVMLNNWEILGCFMYPKDAYRRLFDLCRSGLLDLTAIHPRTYALPDLPKAMAEASRIGSLECVVMNHQG